MTTKEFDVLCCQLASVAVECEHVISWVCRTHSTDQIFTTGDTLVIQVSAYGLVVQSVTQFFDSLQAIVKVCALLMFVQHMCMERVVCGECFGTNVTQE